MPVSVRTRQVRHEGAERSPGTGANGKPNRYRGKGRSTASRAGGILSGGVTEQLENKYRVPGAAGYGANANAGGGGAYRTGSVGRDKDSGLAESYGVTSGSAPASGSSGGMRYDAFPRLSTLGRDETRASIEGLRAEGPYAAWQASHADKLDAPTKSGDYYEANAGKYNYNPGTNRADAAYSKFMRDAPDFGAEPGLSQYYDLAEKRATNKLNKEFAARGAYGSSAATSGIGSAIAGLEAEKANREADYRLRQIGEQRMWGATGGQLARGGDLTAQGAGQLGLSYLEGGQNAAQAADATGLSQLALGANVAQGASYEDTTRNEIAARLGLAEEDLARAETQGGLSQLASFGGQISSDVGQAIAGLTAQDQQLFEQMLMAGLSVDQMRQIWAQNHTQEEMDQFAGIVASVGSVIGMGAGGG